MYNKDITITKSQLSSGDVIIIEDIWMSKTKQDATGREFPCEWLPKQFQIINDTGSEIKINFISNEEELNHYKTNPEQHTLIRIPAGGVFTDNNEIPLSRYILVKGIAGLEYTSDLIIQLLGYKYSNKVIY